MAAVDHGPAPAGDQPDDDPVLVEALRAEGHRLTQPRRIVWSVLATADDHLTVEALAERVNTVDPSINLASIYRALRLFQELDLVRESNLGDGESWWETAHPDEHIHLVCESCGSVDHHVGSLVQTMTDHLVHHHDFSVASIDVVVRGLCPRCR